MHMLVVHLSKNAPEPMEADGVCVFARHVEWMKVAVSRVVLEFAAKLKIRQHAIDSILIPSRNLYRIRLTKIIGILKHLVLTIIQNISTFRQTNLIPPNYHWRKLSASKLHSIEARSDVIHHPFFMLLQVDLQLRCK